VKNNRLYVPDPCPGVKPVVWVARPGIPPALHARKPVPEKALGEVVGVCRDSSRQTPRLV